METDLVDSGTWQSIIWTGSKFPSVGQRVLEAKGLAKADGCNPTEGGSQDPAKCADGKTASRAPIRCLPHRWDTDLLADREGLSRGEADRVEGRIGCSTHIRASFQSFIGLSAHVLISRLVSSRQSSRRLLYRSHRRCNPTTHKQQPPLSTPS